MDWNFLLGAAVTLVVTFVLIPPLRGLAHRRGWLDYPAERKRHQLPTPFTGGWAVFVGFWCGILVVYLSVPSFAAEMGVYLKGIFAAHLLVFIGGLLDDFFDLRAWLKLVIQSVAALILIGSGIHINTVYVPFTGSYLIGDMTYPLTILWVLMIVNAVNVVDGLDGLAGGLGVVTALGLLYTGLALGMPFVIACAIILIGALLAFLRFNFVRASVFLGDSGAQSIGFVFAVMAIYCPIKSWTVVAMFVPILSLGLPLLELGTSFLRRLLTGRPIMVGGYDHLFHQMVQRGYSKTLTVIIFCAVSIALQIFVFALFLFDRRVVFSILVLFMLATAAWFLRMSRQEDK